MNEEANTEQIEERAEEHIGQEEVNDEPQLTEAEQEAYKQGWRPKETWVEDGKDEDRWRDAETFLAFGNMKTMSARMAEMQRRNEEQERRLQEQEKAFKQGLQMQREQLEQKYDEKIKEAFVDGDVEQFDKLNQEKREAVGKFDEEQVKPQEPETHPAAVAWAEKNDWYEADEAARNLADVTFNRYQKAHPDASIEDALEAAEKRIRRSHPHYFDDDMAEESKPKPRNSKKEMTMADVKVSSGNRGGASKKKSPVDALSDLEKQIGEGFVKDGLFKDLDAYAADLASRNTEREERLNR